MIEQTLISKIRTLSALDRRLVIAHALEAAGVEPMSEEEIAEIKAARAERRAKAGNATGN